MDQRGIGLVADEKQIGQEPLVGWLGRIRVVEENKKVCGGEGEEGETMR